MQNHSDYLTCLPNQSHPLGQHLAGEIEISSAQDIVDSVIRDRKSKQGSIEYLNNDLEKDFPNIGIVFEDEYLIVVRDAVIFKNGKSGSYIRIFERSSLTGRAGAVILPIRDNRIFLNKIFRHTTRQWEIELPRGYREDGDTIEETVEIELIQEVGLEVEKITDLGEIHCNTGLVVGSVQAYLVELSAGETKSNPEDGESISDTLTLTLDEVNEKIINGEIRDGFTLSALHLAKIRNLL